MPSDGPLKSGYPDKLQSGGVPNEDDEPSDELPWDGFEQFVRWLFDYANWWSRYPGSWSQTILEMQMLNVEVLGWCGCMWSVIVREVEYMAISSEMSLKTPDGREMNIQFWQQLSGTWLQSACQLHAASKLVALSCVIKLDILEWKLKKKNPLVGLMANRHPFCTFGILWIGTQDSQAISHNRWAVEEEWTSVPQSTTSSTSCEGGCVAPAVKPQTNWLLFWHHNYKLS